MSGQSAPDRVSMASNRENNENMRKYSPEETARLFFQHLVDNVGQFQQLYDGLFRWKMNDTSSLPPFNSIRPFFLHILLAANCRSATGPVGIGEGIQGQGREWDEPMSLDHSTSSVSESIMNQISELLEFGEQPTAQGVETPFETASESSSISGTGIDTFDIYGRCSQFEKSCDASLPTFSIRNKDDEYWEADNLRSLYENVAPPSPRYKDVWLEQPLEEDSGNLDEDFDFERGLAMFKKIPLKGAAAKVASTNIKKQDRAIKRLFKRARTQSN